MRREMCCICGERGVKKEGEDYLSRNCVIFESKNRTATNEEKHVTVCVENLLFENEHDFNDETTIPCFVMIIFKDCY